MTLTINEIFYSIQGETTTAGLTSVFIRLSGCNLNCSYCDTAHARTEGCEMQLDAILHQIDKCSSANHVTITGGEPLLQNNTMPLVKSILDAGRNVQIETNGSILVKDVPEQARRIVDVKTPSSGEADSFDMRNLKYLTDRDEIKFVIADAGDYDFSKDFISTHLIKKGVTINFSPVYGLMPGMELADRILADQLSVRLNLQLHKILWGPAQRGK
jgi:7-carboxy-7-deazaguanine synthase